MLKPHDSGLTPRQLHFCRHYVVELNGKKAAIAAGFAEKSASQEASRLLRSVKIKAEIAKLQLKTINRVALSAATVLEEVRRLMTLDPIHMYGEDGQILPVPMMPPEIRSCISRVKVRDIETKRHVDGPDGEKRLEVTREQKTEISFWSKPESLRMAMQHFDLLAAAGLTIQQRTTEEEERGQRRLRELNEVLERTRSYWHEPQAIAQEKTK